MMRFRAVIFDVYRTLLEVGPAPDDAAERWELLWEDLLADAARLSLTEFQASCEAVMERESAGARVLGIALPEIHWPAVVEEVLPELTRLPEEKRQEFRLRHIRLVRSTRLAPGAATVLRKLRDGGIILGLASNAHPYTLREFDEALSSANLSRSLFRPDLCFWSFEAGYRKPDPHVFRALHVRLQASGVRPGETLMVGDRFENDVAPARLQGWQTWLLSNNVPHDVDRGGDWEQLSAFLEERT